MFSITRIAKRLFRKMLTLKAVQMADNVDLGRKTVLNVGSEVRGDVKIGNFCAIGRHVTFQGRNHDTNTASVQDILYQDILNVTPADQVESILVGNDVWIGNRVTVLPGTTIGDGAVIGAGAVVSHDVEPFEIVGGVPAEHLGWRFPSHVRNQLMEIRWWEWDERRIHKNKHFFTLDLSDFPEDKSLYDYIN
ncbi:CatB-related O-acetyltransferase [Halorubrum ezzemoulense]|uniref:CatB-related O-acetyltransferase n=1 Tax=Halorubrum ezzemoulense TaxID=337243 RepID=UPI00233159B1|nr:CatB-related O-acetyltransferase [Halorubrum ezzemoulense]MDB9281709.1 CatB-related O-acetyltransferase [Halorubrum ezzemoulense]MDB9285202.1 CatB-related O-acetyltransferase [Halorubrum ezzemoulense]